MPRSKEIQEQIRTKIVNMYQSGKGYTAISKALGLQRTTVRSIIYKWRKLGTVLNLPRSGWTTKITPRAQWQLIQEFIKEPRTTPKEPQASLASIKVSVHDSTIRKRLGKNSLHGRKVQKSTQWLTSHLPKNILTIPKTFGQILCGLMRQNLSFCGSRYIWHKINTGFHEKNIIQQSNMVVIVWWSGAALLLQDLDDLP